MPECGLSIIPIVDERTQDHFVCSDQHPNFEIAESDPTLYTNYLKFGMTHDLLGLSFDDQWLEAGVMDHTDRIGEDFYLHSVLMAKGEDVIVVHCGHTMKFNRQGESPSESLLTCKDASFVLSPYAAGEEMECVIDFHGFLHHEKGQLRVSFDMKEGGDVFTPIGFGIAGTRTNSNRF